MVDKTSSKEWAPTALSLLAVFAVTFIGYSDTFHYPFHFDDRFAIEENPSIRDVTDLEEIWKRNPARFLTFFSLAVNYHIGGLDVFGYHVFNFLTHFIAAALVFWTTRLLLGARHGSESIRFFKSRDTVFPLFMALVFAAHPLQTEAVTYIWQRNTSLAALFYLLSMALYLKSAACGDTRDSNLFLAGSLAAGVAAMFTKQNSVTLPVAIVLMDYFFISGSLRRLREKAGRLAAFIPVLLIVPVLTALGMNEEVTHIGARFENMISPYEYLLTQFNVIVKVYLKLLVYPVGQILDYDFPPARSFADSAGSFAFLILIAASAAWLYNRNRLASFGIFFFFLTLSVESSFFPLEDLVFEHRMYLPLYGAFLALGSIIFNATPSLLSVARARGAMIAFMVVTTAVLTVMTRERNKVWASHETLWLDVVKKNPTDSRGYNNLGMVYLGEGRLDDAEKWFKKALDVKPDSNFASYNLGVIHQRRGDQPGALGFFKRAEEINPAAPAVHYALGNLYLKQEDYVRAANQYRVALKLENYKNIQGLEALGTALFKMGLLDQAVTAYKRILKLEPRHETALNNLAVLYRLKGDKEKSELYARKRDEAKASLP